MTKKIGRNEICPCGSGRKYKKCCEKLGKSSSNNFQRTQRLLEELDKFFLGKANMDTTRFLSNNYGISPIFFGGEFICDESIGLKEIEDKIFWNLDLNIEVTEEQRILSLFLLAIDIIRNCDRNLLDSHNNKFSDWVKYGKAKLFRGIRKEWKPESFDLHEGEYKLFAWSRDYSMEYTGSKLSGLLLKTDKNGKIKKYKVPKTPESSSFIENNFGMTLDELEQTLSKGVLPQSPVSHESQQNGWLLEADVDVKNIHFYSYGNVEIIVKGTVHCKVNEVVKGKILNNESYSKVG